MKSWEEIKKALQETPETSDIRILQKAGNELKYIPNQVFMTYMDAIFDIDGWENECVSHDIQKLEDNTWVCNSVSKVTVHGYDENGNVRTRVWSGVGDQILFARNRNVLIDVETGEIASKETPKENIREKSISLPPNAEFVSLGKKAAHWDAVKNAGGHHANRLGRVLYLDTQQLISSVPGITDEEIASFATDVRPDGSRKSQPQGKEEHVGSGELIIATKKAHRENGAPDKMEIGAYVKDYGDEAINFLEFIGGLSGKIEKPNKKVADWVVAYKKQGEKPKEPEKQKSSESNPIKDAILSLKDLKIDDNTRVSPAAIAMVKKALAYAGYDNDFRVNGMLKQVTSERISDLSKLPYGLAKLLVGFSSILKDGADKEDAKAVVAWGYHGKLGWKESVVSKDDAIAIWQMYLSNKDSMKWIDASNAWSDGSEKTTKVCSVSDDDRKKFEPVLFGLNWPINYDDVDLQTLIESCAKAGIEPDKDNQMFKFFVSDLVSKMKPKTHNEREQK